MKTARAKLRNAIENTKNFPAGQATITLSAEDHEGIKPYGVASFSVMVKGSKLILIKK